MKNYYEILGVEKTATENDIKKAYRMLAKKYHPDKNSGNQQSEEKFKEVVEAFEILSDPIKKNKYDAGGSQSGNFNFHDMFKNAFGGFGGFGFDHTSRTRKIVINGTDIRLNIPVELIDILSGTIKKIKFNKDIQCSSCHGSGAKDESSITICSACKGTGEIVQRVQHNQFVISHSASVCKSCMGTGEFIIANCVTCLGNGIIKHEEVVDISIPCGVKEGMIFQKHGAGNFPKGKGQPGNLIIVFHEAKHPVFHRIENNIHCDLFISVIDAILGNDNVEVPTIEGKATIKIDPATEHGKILRLPRKGVPHLNQLDSLGDQYIHINIYIPSEISPVEKNMLKNMADSPNFQVTESKIQGIKGSLTRMQEYKHLF